MPFAYSGTRATILVSQHRDGECAEQLDAVASDADRLAASPEP